MSTIKDSILDNWETDTPENFNQIFALKNTPYPAWTIRLDSYYGVAIPYSGEEDIYEESSGAVIRSKSFYVGVNEDTKEEVHRLLLISNVESIKNSFALFCEAFINPGDNGENRKKLESSPFDWWKEWNELLGNKNVDQRVYDALGELCTLYYALKKGENPEWHGPEGISNDIETDVRFIEVKSTRSGSKKEIEISNQHQLSVDSRDRPLYLVFCVFERAEHSGISIDDEVKLLIEAGFPEDRLERGLNELGFNKGMNSRKRHFILHEMLLYQVDDSFPKITPNSFKNGVMPSGIVKITYTVDLSGLTATDILKDLNNV